MKVVLHEDESGVSEVIGTILILAITVVLFSTIIIWVTNIPTPSAQIRLDIQSTLNPIYGSGVEVGVNITLLHQGGEALAPTPSLIYVGSQRGTNPSKTDIVTLHRWNGLLGTPSGLLDGTDSVWNVGERWSYRNFTLRSTDTITVLIVDKQRSIVLWSSQLSPLAGNRPPVFVDKWTDGIWATEAIDPVVAGQGFFLFARVIDPDGDLNNNSVYATITAFFNTAGSCAQPQKMRDDGIYPDRVANDGIFSLGGIACMMAPNPNLSWDGSIILLNATDKAGHTAQSRMILSVVSGGPGGCCNNGIGRPQNLRWNGRQGYNLFNATEWDTAKYNARETRTFRESEEVVVVVGSLDLQNLFGTDTFTVTDPFAGVSSSSVVYGASKAVSLTSVPSSNQAFKFLEFINGYYIYTYRFKLNDPPTVGTNFYVTPPIYPRYYYFASYPVSALMTDSGGHRFTTQDSINITAANGYMRNFPTIQTFADPGFTQRSTTFRSTATIYVRVRMFTVNLNTSMSNVYFGNMMIQDYAGGQQLNRAPTNGIYANLPICPIVGSCGSAQQAIWSDTAQVSYEFAINLARTAQDPWVPGLQNYGLTLSSIKDTDEAYTGASTQIRIQAPLYLMDILAGNAPLRPADNWGIKEYMNFYQDFNGYDAWKKLRVDYCFGQTVSGLSAGNQCPDTTNVAVAFGDFWHDGTLGAAESIIAGGNAVVIFRRAVDATGAVIYLPTFWDFPASPTCTAIAAGDVTGNSLPSVICGGSNGKVWYYANNGNWTQVLVDQPAGGQSIKSVTIGDFNGDGWNDIAVAGVNGYLRWYPNLRYGKFQNTGIVDNWFASSEQTRLGNISSGSYLNTYVQDGSFEQLQEGLLNIPVQTGATANPGMNGSPANWTFALAYNTATGTAQAAGGNPGAFAQISTTFRANSVVAGYWYQPFTVSGSPPYTSTLALDYQITMYGATGGGAVTMYAFVDTTSGAPPQNPAPANYVWSSGALTSTVAWRSVTGINVGSKITAPGTYFLKVAMYSTYLGGGSVSVGGFDNVGLTWSSTPGSTSALESYWRMNTLPTRPGTTFTFNLYGHETGGTTPPDFDNFTIAYSTNVAGNDPTTGTYTTMFTVTRATDANYAFALPASVAGLTLWIRVVDTNRNVGATNLDNLFVDYMYINANTPAGPVGITLTNAGDATTINMINAEDGNGDGYSDLVAGTTGGRVFRYLGSSTGLVTPVASWYSTGGASIVGVMWGNFSTTYPGLEIALAFGTTVRVIRGDLANTVIMNSLPAFIPSSAITAFAVGDINGDGWDDIVIGTAGGYIFQWANLGQGTAWSPAVSVETLLGAPVYSLAIGDSRNSLYMGR